jgi:CDP-diacylglycerol---serine O-phosphatidyltransferase
MTTPRRRHFSLLREFKLADWFTLANAACGFGAVLALVAAVETGSVRPMLLATLLVPLALVFDVLDGRIARWRHQQSSLGRELDSLADVISFGVAPAVFAYAAGMRGGWDAVVLVYFVCCGVSRLARYNVGAAALTDADADAKVTHFEGAPIPTSTLLVLLLGAAAWSGATGDALWGGVLQLGPWQLHPLVLLFALSGSLMISRTLRIPKP